MGSQPEPPRLLDGRITIAALEEWADEWNAISHDGSAGGEQYNASDFVQWLKYNLAREERPRRVHGRLTLPAPMKAVATA
jgi:hypothetical protein